MRDDVTFHHLVDVAFGNIPSGGLFYYLTQTSLPRFFPELLPDIIYPPYLGARPQDSRIWIGQPGNVTWLHYDAMHNFLCQVRGRKRLVLFPPSDLRNLYPQHFLSPSPHHSQVDIEAADYEKFPRARRAVPVEVTLEQGEMLFLPAGWWHQVYSLEAAISVNFWWEVPRAELLRAPTLRLMPSFLKGVSRDLKDRTRKALIHAVERW